MDTVKQTLVFNKEHLSHVFLSNTNSVRWNLIFNDNRAYLILLHGAGSADVYYVIIGDQGEPISHRSATIEVKEHLDLKFSFEYNHLFHFELCVFRLNPYLEVPQQSTLSADLSLTIESDKGLKDVVLHFGPEKERVQASKFMLFARSPVFKTMFAVDMKESKSNEVSIPDISVAVGKEMITYIYTDKAPNVKTMTEELLIAAEKYQLPGLKALCENSIVNALNVSNAAYFLLFADRYCGDGKFKKHVLSFITQNKEIGSIVMRSAEWKEVKKSPDLVLAITEKYFDVPAEPESEPDAKPDAKRPKFV